MVAFIDVLWMLGRAARMQQFRAALYNTRVMATTDLASKTCVPCRGGIPPLAGDELKRYQQQLPTWEVRNGHDLHRAYTFPDFRSALAFVNQVGQLAEEQGHHPDIFLTWGKVEITIWTHKIDGLTESDFILAAKIEQQHEKLPR